MPLGLGDLQCAQSGLLARPGLHTIDLNAPVDLRPGETFYIQLDLTAGGQPCDRTSTVDVLLHASTGDRGEAASAVPSPFEAAYFETLGKDAPRAFGTTVVSAAQPGQSYYLEWHGLGRPGRRRTVRQFLHQGSLCRRHFSASAARLGPRDPVADRGPLWNACRTS